MSSSKISQNIQVLSERITNEVNRLNSDPQSEKTKTDSLVYIGNWQDAIPRSIWTDPSLSDIDVRAWGIIRTQAIQGSAVMLSLNNLLKETRGYSNATVSRILYVLRLTRWISLCSTLRSESGTFRGNIYAIHDSPVSLEDALYLDKGYLNFLKKQTHHKNNTIKTLSQTIWSVVSQTVEEGDDFLVNTSSEISTQLNNLIHSDSLGQPKTENNHHVYFLNVVDDHHVQNLNVVAKHQVQILNVDSEKKRYDKNQLDNNHVQFLNVVRSSSSSSSSSFKIKDKEKRATTTNSVGISKTDNFEIQKDLIYPKEFNENENILAQRFLKLVETDIQQNYLDELASKIKAQKQTNNPIKNNIAMLAFLCKEHSQGNICLTSAYLNHQEQRKRKQKRDKKIKDQNQAMTVAALNGENISETVVNGGNKKINAEQQQKSSFSQRWGGMNNATKPKQS